MNKIWFGLGVIILVGVGWTVKDYREWRRLEMQNYGHGYSSEAPAKELGWVYQNNLIGVRFRYPEEWAAEEIWKGTQKITTRQQLAARFGQAMEMDVFLSELSSNDWADARVRGREREGNPLYKERSYIRLPQNDWIIMTWKINEKIMQEAVTKNGDKMVVVRGTAGSEKQNGIR